jgi:biopolymer transport protein ExbD
MRLVWLAMGLALVACGKQEEAAKVPDDEPKAGKTDVSPSAGGVLVTASGTFIDGKQVLPAALSSELAKLAATNEPTFVAIDSEAGTAKELVTLLRAVSAAGFPEFDILVPRGGKRSMLCEHAAIRSKRTAGAEEVALSVTVLESQEVFVGLSRVNEFQQLTDWDTYAKVMKDQKQSAFFTDRETVEIGVKDDAPAGAVVKAIGGACQAGFRQMELLDPKDLSASVPL